MPIRYRIDSENNMIYTKATGNLTDKDILELKENLYNDPDYRAGMSEISDLTEVTQFNITSEGVKKMVEVDAVNAEKIKNHKLAIVANKSVIFGMARMYEMRSARNSSSIAVFSSRKEAEAWLGKKASIK
jgi:hypothetical protein